MRRSGATPSRRLGGEHQVRGLFCPAGPARGRLTRSVRTRNHREPSEGLTSQVRRCPRASHRFDRCPAGRGHSGQIQGLRLQVKRATFVSSSTVVIDAKITCPDEFVGLSVYVRLESTGGSSAVGDASSPPLECTGTPQKSTVAVQNFPIRRSFRARQA